MMVDMAGVVAQGRPAMIPDPELLDPGGLLG
jgi:hypothetical protein